MISLFKQYKGWLALLFVFSVAANGLSLFVPRLVAGYIDAYQKNNIFNPQDAIFIIGGLAVIVLIATILQFAVSAFLSEKIAFDLRARLIGALQQQTFKYVIGTHSSRLLTNMTSDVDAIKNVFAQGVVGLFSAILTFIGVIVLLLTINVKLALITFSVIPFLILTFVFVFGKLSKLFGANQENLEKINKIINESIVASALIRVLNASGFELKKFNIVNQTSLDLGLKTVYSISILIPIITLLANATTLIILWFGGNDVVSGTLSLGQMSAFFAYSAMFIWPLFVLSFSGTMFSRANISFTRLNKVLIEPVKKETGTHEGILKGDIQFKNITLQIDSRDILKDISFSIKPATRTAIMGPTAAGKTQLFYLLSGLIHQSTGDILIDGIKIEDWKHDSLLGQMGLVFQDSIIFNASVRENIQFREGVSKELVDKAIDTAELDDVVSGLPQGLDTIISERGTNLSGGQKQRLMLARALAQNPKILLLDDFTARVDIATEQKIISNIRKNYPDITLVSITQKIDPIKDYDTIIVIMEGELIDQGTHEELVQRSVEYKQIYQSQQKTHE